MAVKQELTAAERDRISAEFRRRLNAQNNLDAGYDAATYAHDIQEEHGRELLRSISRELQLAPNTLARYAAVRRRWPTKAAFAPVARRADNGLQLQWSHVLILESVRDDDARNELIAAALAEALTVRELLARKRQRVPGRHAPRVSIETRRARLSAQLDAFGLAIADAQGESWNRVRDLVTQLEGALQDIIGDANAGVTRKNRVRAAQQRAPAIVPAARARRQEPRRQRPERAARRNRPPRRNGRRRGK